MIFIDANVFMYFVGAEHPLREEARDFFIRSRERDRPLVTSAEVLQELLHHYLRRDRRPLARNLSARHRGLEARDLVHLACCIRRKPRRLMTFDRGLAAAWRSRST